MKKLLLSFTLITCQLLAMDEFNESGPNHPYFRMDRAISTIYINVSNPQSDWHVKVSDATDILYSTNNSRLKVGKIRWDLHRLTILAMAKRNKILAKHKVCTNQLKENIEIRTMLEDISKLDQALKIQWYIKEFDEKIRK